MLNWQKLKFRYYFGFHLTSWIKSSVFISLSENMFTSGHVPCKKLELHHTVFTLHNINILILFKWAETDFRTLHQQELKVSKFGTALWANSDITLCKYRVSQCAATQWQFRELFANFSSRVLRQVPVDLQPCSESIHYPAGSLLLAILNMLVPNLEFLFHWGGWVHGFYNSLLSKWLCIELS